MYDNCCNDIRFNDGQSMYQVRLLFKYDHDLLPDNYNHCRTRLKYLAKQLYSNTDLLDAYNSIIKSQLDSGIIEPVLETLSAAGQVHYLPHRPVLKESKTTKVRMVFDASSNVTRPSLNDCLYPGPSLCESLFGGLLRFRLNNTHKEKLCFTY